MGDANITVALSEKIVAVIQLNEKFPIMECPSLRINYWNGRIFKRWSNLKEIQPEHV